MNQEKQAKRKGLINMLNNNFINRKKRLLHINEDLNEMIQENNKSINFKISNSNKISENSDSNEIISVNTNSTENSKDAKKSQIKILENDSCEFSLTDDDLKNWEVYNIKND